MKKCLLILLALTIVAAAFSSCGTTNGLEVKQKKNDLVISGMNLLSRFDKKLMVNAGDSIYMGVKAEGKLKQLIPDKSLNNFTLPGGMDMLPIIVSQVKTGSRTRPDFNFAFEVTKDLKINLIDLDAENRQSVPKASSRNNPITGFRKTFDLCGSIKAYVGSDNSTVDYQPCLISLHTYGDIVTSDSLVMLHYSYNGKDYESFKLYDQSEFQTSGNGIYARYINLKYGDSFIFVNSQGQTANMTSNCMNLIGIRIGADQLFHVNTSLPSAFRSSNFAAKEKKSYSSKKSSFYKVRTFNPRKYPNCWVTVSVQDIKNGDITLYKYLISRPDGNGKTAIGLDEDGNLNSRVTLDPSFLKRYPKLWDDYGYRNRVECPSKDNVLSKPGKQTSIPEPDQEDKVVDSFWQDLLKGWQFFKDSMKAEND